MVHPVEGASSAVKSDPEHDVCAALQDRRHEPRVIGGIVFQIGILDDRDRPGDASESGADGGPLAAITGLEDQFQGDIRVRGVKA